MKLFALNEGQKRRKTKKKKKKKKKKKETTFRNKVLPGSSEVSRFTKRRGYLDIKHCNTYKAMVHIWNNQFWKGKYTFTSLEDSSCHMTPKQYILDQG